MKLRSYQSRRKYMGEYRKKNRKRMNAYYREYYRVKMSDPEYRAFVNAKKRLRARIRRQKKKSFVIREYKVRLTPYSREFINEYSKRWKRFQRKTNPAYREKEKLWHRRWRHKRMQDPVYRMNKKMEAQERRWAEDELKIAQARQKYYFRKKLLSDPNLQERLQQAVLVQLEQLGFPTSVLKGLHPWHTQMLTEEQSVPNDHPTRSETFVTSHLNF